MDPTDKLGNYLPATRGLTYTCKDIKQGYSATSSHVQIGFPQLPRTGSRAHVAILTRWLQECDKHHPNCTPTHSSIRTIPKRLVDVGTDYSTDVKLYETIPSDQMSYLALSHPWGSPPHFCTRPENLSDHKTGISLDILPATFRDAVLLTRQLGFQYLWIDSLCIVQGPGGDFNEVAKRMEDVFSQAYCVLAASSAQGQTDGMLKPRQQRTHHPVKVTEGGVSVHVCEFMDSFQIDVLDSRLSQRAWVFQERALARRTIFFTDKQTYWECGDGIQCETMTKLQK